MTGGGVVVGDACYSWQDHSNDSWSKFLDATDYLEWMAGRGFSVDTGGDGDFRVIVTITPTKEAKDDTK